MNATFNQILIVDSLAEGQLNTAARLFADARDWARVIGDVPHIASVRVPSSGALLDLLARLAQQASRDPYVPLLHIECHGREEGLEFADGSRLTWDDMKPAFVALNVASRLNLITVVAACHGGAIASFVRAEHRAPFWAFLAPKRQISAGDLETALSAFYQTLMMTRSSERAMGALRATHAGNEFWQLSAQTIYRLIVEGYVERYLTDEAVARRAERLRSCAAEHGAVWSQEQIEAMIRDPGIFERFRREFFMIDLYPEHEERFPSVAL
ncbi:hypothetical protein [Xanthomonas sp. LF06-19]|uniref:hypothetical protein n=1 Tax=Xanthomonas sp. LF06-19 TaxID=3097551 RepID=UPI002A7FA006|nr:hypothetical protein [Xanthomonas sp. LF06-19]MDY4284363.1 hypothetical protein [Xanthomonas sp. LF06-19]